MENNGTTDVQSNLIPFPNLTSRLLERGIQSLQNKDYSKAMDLFEQLNMHEPEDAQAAYGLAVCYVELEKYSKAKKLTETMLKKGIGDYFDVLKLHITILIQLHDYENVVSTIQAVLTEAETPPEVHETLIHLLEFAQIRMQEEPGELLDHKASFTPNIKQDLESPNAERQWYGIQKGKTYSTETVLDDYLDFLKSETGDPFLKSIVLQILMENGGKGQIEVFKFGKRFTVDLRESHLFYQGFTNLVKEELEHVLGSVNPSLQDVSSQIWEHFSIASFPRPLEPNSPKAWSAACYILAHQLNGLEVSTQDLLTYFGVTKEEIARPLEQLKSIEETRSLF